MNVVHLTASTFFGGPERQMLGLAQALPDDHCTVIVSFAEGGRCRTFVEQARRQGIEALALRWDTPYLFRARDELLDLLRVAGADALCCHGYKANLVGRWAARRAGIPVVAVSRGWTAENLRVRFYEAIDRLGLRWMDRVVCVSEGQAAKVRQRTSVSEERIIVIPNAVDAARFADPDPAYRKRLQHFFGTRPKRVIVAAGRLSPEKGFDVLIAAAAKLVANDPSLGIVIFGAGPLRRCLQGQIDAEDLTERVVLAGFRNDVHRYLPFCDLFVLPSFTEGMPNVVLEAMAAGVPVVATAVGGTPELVVDGVTGYLVGPGDADALARRVADVLASSELARTMGQQGQERVEALYTFAEQSRQYQELFASLCGVMRTEAPLVSSVVTN
jgi:glycosyltransferase involved in cell wall biosynthesis